MGFPENVLTTGERVEESLHPHWLTVVGPVALGVVLAAFGIGFAYVTPDDDAGNRIQWVLLVVTLLAAVPLVVVPILRWRSTHYVLTTHRVMVRRGILTKSGKDITLSKITDVSYRQNLVDRLVGAGTLVIESAGDGPDESFHYIPRSDEVQQLLNRLVEANALRHHNPPVDPPLAPPGA